MKFKIISDNNKILNANVSIQRIEGYYGLILESRGGTKDSLGERNTEYKDGLEVILNRLKVKGLELQLFLVSNEAIRYWKNMSERVILVDESPIINLEIYNVADLLKKISLAQKNKKVNIESIGGNSTKKILLVAKLNEEEWSNLALNNKSGTVVFEESFEDENTEFDAGAHIGEASRIIISIKNRRGQQKFREKLLTAYSNKCAITGTKVPSVLQAAHIYPYIDEETHHITNGILLRSDIHDLFDLNLIGIKSDYTIVVCKSLENSEYYQFNGMHINLPNNEKDYPSKKSFELRPLPSGN